MAQYHWSLSFGLNKVLAPTSISDILEGDTSVQPYTTAEKVKTAGSLSFSCFLFYFFVLWRYQQSATSHPHLGTRQHVGKEQNLWLKRLNVFKRKIKQNQVWKQMFSEKLVGSHWELVPQVRIWKFAKAKQCSNFLSIVHLINETYICTFLGTKTTKQSNSAWYHLLIDVKIINVVRKSE